MAGHTREPTSDRRGSGDAPRDGVADSAVGRGAAYRSGNVTRDECRRRRRRQHHAHGGSQFPCAKVEFFDGTQRVGAAEQPPFTLAYQPTPPKLNISITAKATDAAGRSATSSRITCVATTKVQRRYKAYDYEETAETMLKQL